MRGTWEMEERARGGQSRGKASREGRHQLAGEFPAYPRHVAEVRAPIWQLVKFLLSAKPDFEDPRLEGRWPACHMPTLLSMLCAMKRERNRGSPCICVGQPIPSLWPTRAHTHRSGGDDITRVTSDEPPQRARAPSTARAIVACSSTSTKLWSSYRLQRIARSSRAPRLTCT